MRHRFIAYFIIIISCGITQVHAQRLKGDVTLRQIYFEGNKRTRASVMLRELSVVPGDIIAAKDLPAVVEINRKRLMNLPLFSEVIIATDTIADSIVDWRVQVKEQFFILPELNVRLADRNFNVWWNEQHRSLRRINLGVVLKHRNFRGNLERLAVTAQTGYTQKLGIDYFRPYIDKKQQNGIGGSFFMAKNEETYFNTDHNKLQFVRKPGIYIFHQFEAAINYVHRPGYANKHSFELRYRNFKINDTVLKLNPGYFDTGSNHLQLLELTYRYDLNRVDNWNYPTTGFKMVGYLVARQGIVGMNFQTYAQAEIGYFKRLGYKFYYAGVFRGRLTTPQNVPYFFRYAMGSYSEYVRGYEYYVIDGSQYGILRTNLKYELLNINIRHIPINFLSVIPLRIYPKVFADIGYADNKYPGNSFLNNKALIGYGIGVDVISLYDFKFRFEYSFNHLGQKGLFLHLNSE